MAEQQHQQHQRPMPPHGQVQCQECRRVFRREADKARHKCTTERQKPISEQNGAVQCPVCHRWFRSKGGLTVHRCGPVTNPDPANRPKNTTRSRAMLHDKIPSSCQGLCNASSASIGSDGQVTEPGISALLREGNRCRTSMAQCNVRAATVGSLAEEA